MKILILGATGRTGKHLVEAALNKKYTVHVLVRDKTKIQHESENLVVFEGNPDNKNALSGAMQGCEAILSVLNISRTSDFPWAKLRTPKTFLSETLKIIITAAGEEHLNRVIVCTAWGTNETKKDIPGWFRWLIDNSNIGIAYRDHERQESILENSLLDYTIVRPTGLTNANAEKQVTVSLGNFPKPKLTISRKNVAGFMLGMVDDRSFIRKTVTISG